MKKISPSPRRSWPRLALVLGLAGACSTPSVPLPPPVVDLAVLSFTVPTAGQVVLTGMASEGEGSARFYIVNRATGDGVIATAASDGSFTAPPLAASVGDTAELQFERPDGVISNLTCVEIVVGAPLVGADCP